MTQLHGSGAVAQTSYPPPPPLLAPFPPQLRSPRRRTRAVTLALTGLAVVLAAAALVVALLRPGGSTPAPAAARPTPPAAPTYTNEQVAAAKEKACKAAKTINDRLLIETNWPDPAHPGDALDQAQRAVLGADYLAAALWLPTQVDPATPGDLRAAIAAFAAGAGNAQASADVDQLDRAHAVMAASYERIERSCS